MKKAAWMVLVLAVALATGFAEKEKSGYAIVLQAGNETNEGMARAVHALLYATEMAEKGDPVVLVFDGGHPSLVKWIERGYRIIVL